MIYNAQQDVGGSDHGLNISVDRDNEYFHSQYSALFIVSLLIS